MKKNFDIISIGGMNGVGRTTQVNVLCKRFKQDGLKVLVNKIKNEVDYNVDVAKKTAEFLSENPSGVVINDGSIATMIQLDIQNGMVYEDLYEKYRKVIFEYEKLQHKYGMLNILLITNDMEMCNQRIIKRNKLMGETDLKGIDDLQREQGLLKGFKIFDNYTITKSIKFQTLSVDNDESILDINDRVFEIIIDNFTIKKPSFEG